MRFNSHYSLGATGAHAFLSASKYAWLNYDDEKLEQVYAASLAAQKGTRLHDLAAQLIKENVKLPKTRATLNMYVNDAIGFRMTPEQILYYSENAWGTADACAFRPEKNIPTLRIHDLKTGLTQASFSQIDVYGAFFCLEYNIKPFEIDMVWRIYQNNEIAELQADPDVIVHHMEKIKRFDKRIIQMKIEAAGL